MKTLAEADLKDKVVIVRADLNVPLDENGEIINDLRIRASLATLEFLREKGAKKIIVISHLGRPEGRQERLSLRVVARRLGELMPNVEFLPELFGEEVKKRVQKMRMGEILVLENLRFDTREEKNSEELMREIVEATGAEVYIQDGFAVVHRAHASTVAIKKVLPVYAGLLVQKEVSNLEKVLKAPEKPMLVIIGGSKVEDKAPLVQRFIDVADNVVVGGKIAADFTEGEGAMADWIKTGKVYVAEDFDIDEAGRKLDVGPVSTAKIAGLITDAKTIVWNGVLGKVEDPAYGTASTVVAELMGEKVGAETVVCGGDTTGFVENLMLEHPNLEYSLVSTGGGAALEFLLGKELPGLEGLE
ncbi:MAG: phosphoglycerate kinase [Candidatus Saccharibacteria bacterium]|nr:phosphoglycerate kinase [Candidatus Saccharibacteria bacterium]